MLNRRYIRIKVMQALYAYFYQENQKEKVALKQLEESVDTTYDLYMYQLNFLAEWHAYAKEVIELRKQKRIPTQEDLHPNMTFVNNTVLNALEENKDFSDYIAKNHQLSWKNDREFVIKLSKQINDNPSFKEYMEKGDNSLKEDKQIVLRMFEDEIAPDESIHELIEEKNIHWISNLPIANNMVLRTIKNLSKGNNPLVEVYKKEEDREFMIALFTNVIKHQEQLKEWIRKMSTNWEEDRLASIDSILLQMGLTEFLYFDSVPYKVSINEYVEIAKDYSTPKSSQFINGVLDQSVQMLKKENLIE